jgi:hypothetical protein
MTVYIITYSTGSFYDCNQTCNFNRERQHNLLASHDSITSFLPVLVAEIAYPTTARLECVTADCTTTRFKVQTERNISK